jgi:hypothetical protein
MNTNLTGKERELRNTNKKIRHLKSKESWNMEKIGELEEKSSLLNNEISHNQKKKNEILAQKAKEEKMTDDDWIDHFSGSEPMTIDDHIIPNTRETRLLRKRVIQNIQNHMLDEEIVRQLQLTRIMDAIDGIQKEQGKKKKNKTNQITS